MTVNEEKLKKIQTSVRIGGKGTQRRKKKVVHKSSGTDDRKLQSCLKKLGAYPIPGFEEVTMFKDDATVMVFKNPKISAAYNQNTYAIEGNPENKSLTDIIPSYLQQLNAGTIDSLASTMANLKAAQDLKKDSKNDQPPNLEEITG